MLNSDLIGGFAPSEKHQSAGIIIPNTWKIIFNKSSKPPTSDELCAITTAAIPIHQPP